MWTDYFIRYIKYNKITSFFLAGISLLSSMLLSLSCGVFYNLWIDRVNQEILKTGSYQVKFEPIVLAFAFVLIVICASLIAMIYNAFEVSMNSRIHQLGILKSVGATPKQIRTFLLQEVLILCIIPILIGLLLGILLCYGFIQFVIFITAPVRVEAYEVLFSYHITVAVVSLVMSILTVLISAWIPARRISRLTPLDAIHYGGDIPIWKMRRFRFFSSFFGITGELARKSIYSRRKALRTSTISLTFSFLALIGLLNIETISGISTQHTYFERFRNKWDIMLTTTNMQNGEDVLLQEIKSIDGVKSCIAYNEVMAFVSLPQDALSAELQEAGIENITDGITMDGTGRFQFMVPIYVLDNDSFKSYCKNSFSDYDLSTEDVVAINRIWDSLHSNHKNKEYLPLFNTEEPVALNIYNDSLTSEKDAFITVSAFTDNFPDIREDFIKDSLTLIVSMNRYENIADRFAVTDRMYNIRLTSDDMDQSVQNHIHTLLAEGDQYTLDSRQQDEITEIAMRKGLKTIFSVLAGLLSTIGITNVFSTTLGQIYQRSREFARYLSVGLSPKGMKKILIMEALIISLKPIVISLLVNIPILVWVLNASYIPAKEYMTKAPILPVLIVTIFVLFFISLAYYLGGRKICNANITDILKDETMN